MLDMVESLIFPGGLAGSGEIFALIFVVIVVMLLFMLRLPMFAILLLVLPIILIGGGNLIAGSIPGWIKLLIVVGIMIMLGLAYISLTSSNK